MLRQPLACWRGVEGITWAEGGGRGCTEPSHHCLSLDCPERTGDVFDRLLHAHLEDLLCLLLAAAVPSLRAGCSSCSFSRRCGREDRTQLERSSRSAVCPQMFRYTGLELHRILTASDQYQGMVRYSIHFKSHSTQICTSEDIDAPHN